MISKDETNYKNWAKAIQEIDLESIYKFNTIRPKTHQSRNYPLSRKWYHLPNPLNKHGESIS